MAYSDCILRSTCLNKFSIHNTISKHHFIIFCIYVFEIALLKILVRVFKFCYSRRCLVGFGIGDISPMLSLRKGDFEYIYILVYSDILSWDIRIFALVWKNAWLMLRDCGELRPCVIRWRTSPHGGSRQTCIKNHMHGECRPI